MSSYTDPLEVKPLDEDMRRWELLKEFRFVIDSWSDEYVVVPQGFITDFATIPWPLTYIISRTGKYGKACVVHDYLCTYKTIFRNHKKIKIKRKEGDEIFLQAMEVSNVGLLSRYLMYGSVRAYAIIKGIK